MKKANNTENKQNNKNKTSNCGSKSTKNCK